MHKQTSALAALALNASQQQSTTPKSVQTVPNGSQPVVTESDDVIYTNHFSCSFASGLIFYQYDATVEEYHEKQQAYINLSNREKRQRFVSDLLLAKKIHPTAVCWYDEGHCIYSTTNFQDKLPIVYEDEEQDHPRRLTINSLSATNNADDLNQSSIRIIETLLKQVLKEQFKVIGSTYYRWDEQPGKDGPYDLLTGFKQALCITESGPTLNLDTTITRFYPHHDLLQFILERLLQRDVSAFRGMLDDTHYSQISNYLKDVEVTTVQSEYRKKYVLTGDFSEHLPERIFIDGQKHLLNYYQSLGFNLRYPKLYCVKAYESGNRRKLVDLPIELCSLQEWQQVRENARVQPVRAPAVDVRFRSITEAIKSCNFRDHELCKEIQFEIESQGMMAIPYETLRRRQITLSQGRGFTNPVSIDRMGFIYLAERRQQDQRHIQEKLLNNFYDVSIPTSCPYLKILLLTLVLLGCIRKRNEVT